MENSIVKKLPDIRIETILLLMAITIGLTVILVRQMERDLRALENNVYNNRINILAAVRKPCGCKDAETDASDIATASAEMEVENGIATAGNEHPGSIASDI
jgi:hypothetical protein